MFNSATVGARQLKFEYTQAHTLSMKLNALTYKQSLKFFRYTSQFLTTTLVVFPLLVYRIVQYCNGMFIFDLHVMV